MKWQLFNFTLSVLILSLSFLQGQNQIGQDLFGESEFDHFGFAISSNLDGSILVIASPVYESNQGRIHTYRVENSQWQEIGEVLYGSDSEQFGRSVSLSDAGNRMAIGCPLNSDIHANGGRVRIMEWNGVVWEQIGADILGIGTSEQAGYSVAISGSGKYFALGANLNRDSVPGGGHVRVFQDTPDGWLFKWEMP